MSAKILSAGDYISSKCSRCKDTTGHTIVAMVGEKVVKVQCNTCGSQHNYRAVTAKKIQPRASSATAKPRVSKTSQARQQRLADLKPEEAVSYSMQAPMQEGMTLNHPKFGLGLVMRCIRPNKMEVEFSDGCRLLRCKIDSNN